MDKLWPLEVPALALLVRGLVVYIFVLLLIRLSGKRQLGQMSATEFVALLLISNAVQNAMNGGDNSLSGGLLLALVLMISSWSIAWVNFRSRRMRTIFEGTPTLVIHRGQPILENLKKELLSLAELKTLLRKQGIHHIEEVKTAVLESDGSLTVDRNGTAAGTSNKHGASQ